MKALTIWQPWASLIMAGAKPFEFRGWAPPNSMVGQRIVIHAGARKPRPTEISELLVRLERGEPTGLLPVMAADHLRRWLASPGMLPLACGLGTALLGKARSARVLFGNDSDRDEHFRLAWPLTDVQPFEHPVPARGAQGLWGWPLGLEKP